MTTNPSSLALRSEQVSEPTAMTSDLLGVDIATACLPYWRHDLGPLHAPLTSDDAVVLAALAWSVAPGGPKPLVVYYPADGGASSSGKVVVDRKFATGRWFRRERRVLGVECAVQDELAGLLSKVWNESGNDTLIVVVGAQPSALDFLQTRFVDDVEANPTNEEGLLLHSVALLSRGWDGLDARIYSRVLGPVEVEAALTRTRA